ncbi:MAG TPA: PilN domain-containing protein [Solirubrobacterales bacterium]|jgi:Tfp pilus assembly protein PilN|nr:PilN domain-containing protein [Solirubrobacterales bacterium]
MRPVNLIPPEERPGERKPMRGGPLAYIVVGALFAALLGVTVLVVTGNQISDRKAEVVTLENERAAVEARAQALDAYTQFHTVREQRVATVSSLADSRFDWQRVMRELSLVLPSDVWLTNLTGSASPQATPDGAANVALRSTIPGPALELVGCATSQDAVAGLIQALKEVDGVTRVGVQSSALGSGSSTSGSSTASSCQTHDFIAQFQMVAAFDAAPVSSEATGEGEAAPAPAPSTTTSASAGSAGAEPAGAGEGS